MKFTDVQLRYIGAIHGSLSQLEKEIDDLPVNVMPGKNKIPVLLQCIGGSSIRPEFRPEDKEDKVQYQLAENFPYTKFRVTLVPEPTPHLVVKEIDGNKEYHFYTDGPGVVKT